MTTSKELLNDVETVGQGQREDTNGTPDTEATADPIPEAEDIVAVDTELGGFRNVSTSCADVSLSNLSLDLFKGSVGSSALVVVQQPFADSSSIKHSFSSSEGL